MRKKQKHNPLGLKASDVLCTALTNAFVFFDASYCVVVSAAAFQEYVRRNPNDGVPELGEHVAHNFFNGFTGFFDANGLSVVKLDTDAYETVLFVDLALENLIEELRAEIALLKERKSAA